MSLPLATFGSAILAVVTLLILSQYLSPSEFGILMLITGTGQFASVLAFEWLRLCALRYGGRSNFDQLRVRELFLAVSLLVIAATIVSGILQRVGFVRLYLAETLGYALCLGLSDGVAAYLRARGLFATASTFWIARSVLGLGAGLVLALVGADGATASIGLGLSYLLAVLPVIARTGLAHRLNMQGSLQSAPKLFHFGAPLMVAGLMNTGIAAAARALVAVTAGVAAAGAFALIWELASKALGSAAAAVTATSLRGLVVAHDGSGGGGDRTGAYRSYAVAVLAVTLPAASGLVAVGGELLPLLLPTELWTVADGQLPWTVVGCFGLVAKTFLVDSVFFATERPYAGAVASLAGVLGTIVPATIGTSIGLDPVATVGSSVAIGCLAAAIATAALSQSKRIGDGHWWAWDKQRGLFGVAVATSIMAFAVSAMSPAAPSYANLAIRVTLGIVTYAVVVLLLDRFARTGIVAAATGSLRRSLPSTQGNSPH